MGATDHRRYLHWCGKWRRDCTRYVRRSIGRGLEVTGGERYSGAAAWYAWDRPLDRARHLHRGDGRKASTDHTQCSYLSHPQRILATPAIAPTLDRRKARSTLEQFAGYRALAQNTL